MENRAGGLGGQDVEQGEDWQQVSRGTGPAHVPGHAGVGFTLREGEVLQGRWTSTEDGPLFRQPSGLSPHIACSPCCRHTTKTTAS